MSPHQFCQVISLKGYTNWAIGMSTAHLCKIVLNDTRSWDESSLSWLVSRGFSNILLRCEGAACKETLGLQRERERDRERERERERGGIYLYVFIQSKECLGSERRRRLQQQLGLFGTIFCAISMNRSRMLGLC